MMEKGIIIKFDSDEARPGEDVRRIGMTQIISLDGESILDIFPGNKDNFPYATEVQRRAQAQTPISPTAVRSAEERKIAELEAELQRLHRRRVEIEAELQRLKQGR